MSSGWWANRTLQGPFHMLGRKSWCLRWKACQQAIPDEAVGGASVWVWYTGIMGLSRVSNASANDVSYSILDGVDYGWGSSSILEWPYSLPINSQVLRPSSMLTHIIIWERADMVEVLCLQVLTAHFQTFGTVMRASVQNGSGSVEFATKVEATKALALNRSILLSRPIVVVCAFCCAHFFLLQRSGVVFCK